MITLVQISDIHFRNDHTNLNRVQKLLSDLKLVLPEEDRAYLFLTGDIVNNGDENLYDSFANNFILPATGLFSGIVCCPGNHDIQRSRNDDDLIDAIASNSDRPFLYNKLGQLNHSCPFKQNNLENYSKFETVVTSPTMSNFYGSRHDFPEISVVSLNTTWLSRGREKPDSDRGKLRLEVPIVESLAHSMPADRLKIAIMHHPLDWIAEDARSDLEKFLTAEFDMVMYGHVHSPTFIAGVFPGGNCLLHQAPTVRSNDTRGANAYTVIRASTEAKKYKIDYRQYSIVRDLFIEGDDFAEKGTVYPTISDRTFWERQINSSPNDIIRSFKTKVQQCDFAEWSRINTPPKTRSNQKLVEPHFRQLVFANGQRTELPKIGLLDAISKLPQQVFFMGPSDSGLSTAAFLAIKHISLNIQSYDAIPAYIHISNMHVNRATLISEATKTCPAKLSHGQIESLAISGDLIFFIDGMSLPNTEKFNHTLDTIKTYFPKTKSIIFCTLDGPAGNISENIEVNLDPASDIIYEIEQLGTSSIRELVEYHFPDKDAAGRQTVVEHIIQSFRGMDEPIFASAAVLLIDTLKQIPDYKPINRIRMLDRYVEVLLGRLEAEDIRTGSFSSTDKITLLSYLAGHFALTNTQFLEPGGWTGFISSYSKDKLLAVPARLLEEFVAKGILLDRAGRVTFRADYLFSYFVARQMHQSPYLREQILSGDNFFSFHKEIAAYGELEGVNNFALIESVHERLELTETAVLKKYTDAGVDLNKELSDLFHTVDSSVESKFTDSAKSLADLPDTQAPDDSHLDVELQSVERARGILPRTEIRHLESKWLNSLTTYLKLLKHSENLNGQDKIKHIEVALTSGQNFVKTLAFKRAYVARSPAVIIDGILYLNPLASVDPDKSQEDFKYAAPMSFGRVLQENLSNPKLSPVFRAIHENGSELQKYFVRRLLLDHSDSKNSDPYSESLVKSQEIILQTCSLRELKSDYILQSHTTDRRIFLKQLVEKIAKSKILGGMISKSDLDKRRLFERVKAKNLQTSE